MTDKKTLRKFYAARREAVNAGDRKNFDRAIRARIRALPEYRNCRALALYATDGKEPDLLPLAEHADKILLFPRYRRESGVYEFAVVRSPQELQPGKYGILEPCETCPAADAGLVRRETLHLVPGVAFDLDGTRLGRGGGFYDRLLEGVTSPVCGVYYSCQCSPEKLPEESHDRKMDMAVTEVTGLRWKNSVKKST